MKKVKKFIFKVGVLLIVAIGVMFTLTNLRDKENLISKIQFATNPGESGYAFNSRGKLKYSDLSLKLRKKITKAQFEGITTYLEAEQVFNAAYEKIVPLPKDAYSIDQPILCGTLIIDNKECSLDNQIVLGYDYFIKPVIIEWYINIEPFN